MRSLDRVWCPRDYKHFVRWLRCTVEKRIRTFQRLWTKESEQTKRRRASERRRRPRWPGFPAFRRCRSPTSLTYLRWWLPCWCSFGTSTFVEGLLGILLISRSYSMYDHLLLFWVVFVGFDLVFVFGFVDFVDGWIKFGVLEVLSSWDFEGFGFGFRKKQEKKKFTFALFLSSIVILFVFVMVLDCLLVVSFNGCLIWSFFLA